MSEREPGGPLGPTLECLNAIASALDAPLALRPGSPAERLLADLAPLAAVSRLDDVFSLLRSGTGATVAGALARALVEQAVVERWVSIQRVGSRPRCATLSRERRRIADVIQRHDLCVPNLDRWLHPLGFRQLAMARAGKAVPDVQRDLAKHVGPYLEAVLRIPAGVTDLLSMCGHASYAGAWCSAAAPPHAIGFEATPTYAAVFAQCAGAAAASVAPEDLDDLTDRLVYEASLIHGLPQPKSSKNVAQVQLDLAPDARPGYSSPIEYLATSPVHDQMLAQVLHYSDRMWALLGAAPNPFGGDPAIPINLTSALPFLTAISTAEVALSALRGRYSPYAGATAARMLLEEGARRAWQFGTSDEVVLRERYIAIADEETQRRLLLRRSLRASGASDEALSNLFEALKQDSPLAVDTRRTPANTKATKPLAITAQMLSLGAGFSEAGWFDLAYSLLSQVAHGTPLGMLHATCRQNGDALVMSYEMCALVADAACIGVTQVLGPFGMVLGHVNGLGDVREWLRELNECAAKVHRAAQPLHFLD